MKPVSTSIFHHSSMNPTNQLHLKSECYTLLIVFLDDPSNVQLNLSVVIVVATQKQQCLKRHFNIYLDVSHGTLIC